MMVYIYALPLSFRTCKIMSIAITVPVLPIPALEGKGRGGEGEGKGRGREGEAQDVKLDPHPPTHLISHTCSAQLYYYPHIYMCAIV